MQNAAEAAALVAAKPDAPEAQFVIPAAESFQQSRPRILKQGDIVRRLQPIAATRPAARPVPKASTTTTRATFRSSA